MIFLMKKLFEQIIKFGIVGFVCFFIDWLIGLAIMKLLLGSFGNDFYETASVIGSVVGFIVSVIVNYILSFKFVFARKENLNRKLEFIAFIFLSVIGMALNSFIIWVGVGPVYSSTMWLQENFDEAMMYTVAKVVATAIVMVYNFITRKIFLEQKNTTIE